MKKIAFIVLLFIAGSVSAKTRTKQSHQDKPLGVYAWFVLHPTDALLAYKPEMPSDPTKEV
ncbi:hypothetical protein A3F06_00085 [candidate division TM6 bacterium RIFCSPHIGHO2_12_FULL_36_22]|nr:MAG: hypothetical protein A3F06_00085 [candidate division TM6 bacterium RIFCSPHIGHO2_12_FULL_36_22]